MGQERFVASARCQSTPNETWTLERPITSRLMYGIAADRASSFLGEGFGRSCLVIGSPIFEASMLSSQGWDVTYCDVRDPPRHQLPKVLQCDATSIDLPSDSFDAVSSTCVLAHVGLGRYGDNVTANGDDLMLGEIYRLLKSSGKAALTFGNVSEEDQTIRLGTCHRIYSRIEVRKMVKDFEIVKEEVWNSGGTLEENDYITMLVVKP